MNEFDALQAGYSNLWAKAQIRPEHLEEIKLIVERLEEHKDIYSQVEQKTNVPWWAVAVLDQMEGGGGARTHLHNGDSLGARTVHVPAGRPRTGIPPFNFVISAIDAVQYDGLDKVQPWTVPRALFEFECHYNGKGYFKYGVNSPYLWSYTTLYGDAPNVGKFVSDGHFDSEAISKQVGIAAMLKFMEPQLGLGKTATPTASVSEATFHDLLGKVFGGVSLGEDSRPAIAVALNDLFDGKGTVISGLNKMFGTKKILTPSSYVSKAATTREPIWIPKAKSYVGFHEKPGNTGLQEFILLAHCGRDGDPWCAIFVNACIEGVGLHGTQSAMARSFEKNDNFLKLSGPALGAITTMWRGSPSGGSGHVFFYMGENQQGIMALGGNQNDQVRLQYEPRNRVVGYYWPKGYPLPKIGAVSVSNNATGGSEE